MKIKIFLSILAFGLFISAFTQKPTMELTFTAENNGQNVPLNSILIENLTQDGDTILQSPDNVLVIYYTLSIGNNGILGENTLSISQNYPNPFKGKTKFDLYLPEKESIIITGWDILGRELVQYENMLNRGHHTFTFYAGNGSYYLLTVTGKQTSQTIKMINSPSYAHGSENCKLEYNGHQTDLDDCKSGNNLNNFVFSLGDQLKYTASSTLGDRTIIDTPSADQTYTFQYGSAGTPCPGMPTVNDIDGNVYNTVLIGDQCWMKENLKTTTYRNGTPIPNVTDDNAWVNLTSAAYVWYGNDISWKDKYGALYNWYTTIDPNGLCPTGWHVPSNDEWTDLTDYIGGTGSPHGNELKSCSQVNSPLGGSCNTSEHPRWSEHGTHYGTDDYGFSGLPGGYRDYDGSFDGIGTNGYGWLSTEYSSFNAWYRSLYNSYGLVHMGDYDKRSGVNVRCLRD